VQDIAALVSGEGSRYWAIDSVAVHQGELVDAETPTRLWTVSDIQGHPQDFEHGLNDLTPSHLIPQVC